MRKRKEEMKYLLLMETREKEKWESEKKDVKLERERKT